MEPGFTNSNLLIGAAPWEPALVFVVQKVPTSTNLIKAFKQGLADVPQNQAYLLEGRRCTACGLIELVGTQQTSWQA